MTDENPAQPAGESNPDKPTKTDSKKAVPGSAATVKKAPAKPAAKPKPAPKPAPKPVATAPEVTPAPAEPPKPEPAPTDKPGFFRSALSDTFKTFGWE